LRDILKKMEAIGVYGGEQEGVEVFARPPRGDTRVEDVPQLLDKAPIEAT